MFPVVFFYDLVRTARRGRHTFIRVVYAGVLTLVLLNMYAVWMVPQVTSAIGSGNFLQELWNPSAVPGRELVNFASTYFYAFVGIQMLVVFLLTPPYVAGAIAEERERGTLEGLFVTHLRNDQIVLGLLLSRLARLGMILLTGLPIVSLLQLLGGIDPNLVFAVFTATGITALSVASLGMLLSIYAGKARRAIMRTELIVIGYLILTTFVEIAITNPLLLSRRAILLRPVFGTTTFGEVLAWPALGNPAVASYRLFEKLSSSVPFALLLQDYLLDYALFHGAIAAVCITWAILRLRAVALREPGTGLLAGDARRRVSPVVRWCRRRLHDWPLIWKGLVVDSRVRQGPLAWLFRGCGGALLFWPVLHLVSTFGRFSSSSGPDHFAWLMNDWCRVASAFLGSAMLLTVALRSAGSISGERDRQTLDSLLATPLRNRTIILAKWLSCILSPSGWGFVLGAVWMVSLAMGALHPAAIFYWLLAWLIDAAFVAAVGVWFSAVCPTTRRSVLSTAGLVLTLLILLAVIAVHWGATSWAPSEAFRFQPPVTFALLAFSPADRQDLLSSNLGPWPPIVRSILQMQALGAIASFVFLFFANLDFRRITGRREGSAPAAILQSTIVGTADNGVDEYEVAPRGNWPRRLTYGLLLCLPLSLLACWYLIRADAGERKLSALLANLDRTDPGWRLEDIEARRAVVPDKGNSALRVLDAAKLLPIDDGAKAYWTILVAHPAQRQLSKEQMASLNKELDKSSAARNQARSLSEMPYGRFPVHFSADGIGTDLGHCNQVRRLADLLHLDVINRAEAGDADGALRSCRALVNAGRSIGDEPAVMSQSVRAQTRTASMLSIERTLAQGQPSAGALETLQHLLERDEQEPLFLIALRGERAAFDRFVEAMRRGESNMKALRGDFSRDHWSIEAIQTVMGGSLKAQRAALLDYYTQVIQVERFPPDLKSAPFVNIQRPSPLDQPLIAYLIISVDRIGNSHRRALAEERCAIVALAAEQYRRATGRWPETLGALVPEYLSKVPADPFTGQPLLYRPRLEGIVIYSVGVDGLDNGGKLDRKNPYFNAAGFDVGIQLWNVDKRRQPFGPK